MKRSRERKETRDNNNGIITAAESPWFLVKGKNILVREVSIRLLLLALLEDQGQTNRGGNAANGGVANIGVMMMVNNHAAALALACWGLGSCPTKMPPIASWWLTSNKVQIPRMDSTINSSTTSTRGQG